MIVKKRICSRMTVYLILFLTIQSIPQNLQAGMEDLPVGARSLAMGAAYVGIANTADAVFLNPAGLGKISGIEATLFYQKPFGLDEISFGSAALGLPLWEYRIGMGVSQLGHEFYKEQKFTLAFSHHYHKKFYFGIGLNYQTLSIDGYGSTGTFGLDLGILVPLNSKLNWGFQTGNINRASIGSSDEKQPQILKTGLSFQAHSRLLLAFEIFKDVRYAEEFRFGAEFEPISGFALRAGMASNPDRFSSGFGIAKNIFKVDYAFFTHNDLGLTHQLSFSIHLNKKKTTRSNVANVIRNTDMNSQKIEISSRRVNLNQASAKELQTLPGIGPALAAAILAYRDEKGKFQTIEELQNVPGIGTKTLEKLRDKITVEEEN